MVRQYKINNKYKIRFSLNEGWSKEEYYKGRLVFYKYGESKMKNDSQLGCAIVVEENGLKKDYYKIIDSIFTNKKSNNITSEIVDTMILGDKQILRTKHHISNLKTVVFGNYLIYNKDVINFEFVLIPNRVGIDTIEMNSILKSIVLDGKTSKWKN